MKSIRHSARNGCQQQHARLHPAHLRTAVRRTITAWRCKSLYKKSTRPGRGPRASCGRSLTLSTLPCSYPHEPGRAPFDYRILPGRKKKNNFEEAHGAPRHTFAVKRHLCNNTLLLQICDGPVKYKNRPKSKFCVQFFQSLKNCGKRSFSVTVH